MIAISLNGKPQSVEQGLALLPVLEALGYRCEKIAVAINGEFVARSEYNTTLLREDDRVDVVAPVQGG